MVKIMDKSISMLLDTGAHVSVLPKNVAQEIVALPSEGHGNRHVKVFGGQEIVLDGPLNLNITICGLQIVHPFFYVDAEIPAIGGYDLLKAAHIMIDTQSAEVWSKHPNVVRQASLSENIFVTVQPPSIPTGVTSPSTDENASVPCVTDNTPPSIQKDTPLTVPGVLTHHSSPLPASCVQEDTASMVPCSPPHS